MSINTATTIQEEAIRATVDNALVGLPIKIRPVHRSQVKGRHKSTIWRAIRDGRIPAPLRDKIGP